MLSEPVKASAAEAPSARDALISINSGSPEEAIRWLERLAAEGDELALIELSDLYLDGHFVPFDKAKSDAYLDLAVVTGDLAANYTRAFVSNDRPKMESMLRQGYSLAACGLMPFRPELKETCQTAVKQEALSGNRLAIYALYTWGDPLADPLLEQFPYPRTLAEIAKNTWINDPSTDALRDLIRLVSLGSAKAAVDVIANYYDGEEKQNLRRQLILDLPATSKSVLANRLKRLGEVDQVSWVGTDFSTNKTLGKLYSSGSMELGIESNYLSAFRAFANCSKALLDSEASSCLYEQALLKRDGGPGLLRAPDEALELFKKSSDRGDMVAPSVLADIYRYGTNGVQPDFQLSAQYSRVAIERGNFYEADDLAELYRDGLGVAQDFDLAAKFYEMSAAEDREKNYPGSPHAMMQLAQLHESGNLQGSSLLDALNWYKKAAVMDEQVWASFGATVSQVREQIDLAQKGMERVSQRIEFLSSDTEVSMVNPSTDFTDFGTYRVLIIANQAYDNLINLSTPKSDAALVGATFESRFGAQVEYLFDADRIEMLSALNRYRRELMPTDNFILYYAGHGIYDDELNIGYWQPIDSTVDEDYTWIDTDRISRTLSGFKSRNALVVADSCFSGSVVRGNEFASSNGNSSKALLALSAKKTRMAITSGGLQPVLDVAGNSQTSAFASNLADVLNTVNGPVPISSLFPQIRSSVTAETAAWGFEQIPEMAPLYKAGHDGGDFILSPQVQAPN